MGYFQNRKMSEYSIDLNAKICASFCDDKDDAPDYGCPPPCVDYCPHVCKSPIHHPSHKPSTFLTATIVLLAASFLCVCAYALYARYYARARRNNTSTPIHHHHQEDRATTFDAGLRRDFLDEERRAATVEHHVWYIRTVGLDPAAIGSITAFKYRKDDGLVDGSDCSVCLSEFQDDEALRLLPKCSHAFHVACIDTWLRSHTNCPLCRAPVLSPAPELTTAAAGGEEGGSTAEEGGQSQTIPAGGGESSNHGPDETISVVVAVEPSRRSVSLDCLDAKELEMINKLRNNQSNNNNGEKRVAGEKKFQRLRSGGSSSSSPSAMKRSRSCNGKFVMCRQIRVTDSILPLRSI